MKTIAKEPADRFPSAADFAMALKGCLPGEVREDAIRSVPPSDDSQRFYLEGQRAADRETAVRDVGGNGSGPKSIPAPAMQQSLRAPARGSVGQSPVLWAALGAGAMLLVGGMIALAVFLLR